MTAKDPTIDRLAQEVHGFWFADGTGPAGFRPVWFQAVPDFDRAIAARFAGAVEEAAAGELDGLAATPRGSLALVILLDQFPRNLFRGQARAFVGDAKARAVAGQALERSFEAALVPLERHFLYLPFQHSEALDDQRRSLDLYTALAEAGGSVEALDHARRHHEAIARFGRFPHRNADLGRATTAAEQAYLATPEGRYWLS